MRRLVEELERDQELIKWLASNSVSQRKSLESSPTSTSSDTIPEDDVFLRGLAPEEIALKDQPPLSLETEPIWWERVVRPILDQRSTLRELAGTSFLKE